MDTTRDVNTETDPHDFPAAARRVLDSVLDEIIPPSRDGKLPGAGQLGIAPAILKALSNLPDLRAMIAQGVADLDAAARQEKGQGFVDLPQADKLELMHRQAFVLPLTFQTYVGYYQDVRVVAALGLAPRPPHPEGYDMPADDLSLLDPVRQRPKMFRTVPSS